MRFRIRTIISYASLPLLLLATGCGASEPGLVPVRGTVTLDGGAWPKEGTIHFTNAAGPAEGDPSKVRPGSARFSPDGSFVAGSFEDGDGLFPGTYKVAVTCEEAPAQISDTGKMIEAKSFVPKKYRDPSTSGLTLTVKADGPVVETFDVISNP